jgi:hypothetical protein
MGIRSTGDLERVSNLKGIILPKDGESVLAGRVLSWLDDPADPDGKQVKRLGELGRTKVAGRVMRKWGESLPRQMATAGAWNSEGWITYMPDYARATLAAAGGYLPNRTSEAKLRGAEKMSAYLSRVHPHEVQHSVSDPSPTAYQGEAKWMEEGTADVMALTPVFHTRNRKAAGMSAASYAGHLAHQPHIDLGWKPWTRPTLPADEKKKSDDAAKRNYGKGQATLTELVKLAGADFRTKAGQQRVFHLLQEKSMRFTPGVLAKAIIEHHGLDPKVYERLRTRIKGAVDLPGGVPQLATEFGIG